MTKTTCRAAQSIFAKRSNFRTSSKDACRSPATTSYELYVNGRIVGSGSDWKNMQTFDVQKFLQNGRNVVAVKADNINGSTAGLVGRVIVKQKSGTEVSYSSDTILESQHRRNRGWEKLNFNDSELGRCAELWRVRPGAALGRQSRRGRRRRRRGSPLRRSFAWSACWARSPPKA